MHILPRKFSKIGTSVREWPSIGELRNTCHARSFRPFFTTIRLVQTQLQHKICAWVLCFNGSREEKEWILSLKLVIQSTPSVCMKVFTMVWKLIRMLDEIISPGKVRWIWSLSCNQMKVLKWVINCWRNFSMESWDYLVSNVVRSWLLSRANIGCK